MTRRHLDPDAAVTAVVGIVGAVLLIVVVLGLQAFFYGAERREAERKNVAPGFEELVALRADQQEQLNSYRWIDEPGGVVGLPIERAMELVVARQRGGGAGTSGAGATPSVP